MSEELKIKQMQAARMLVFGWDVKKIASALEVCTDTIYRWQKLPEFREYTNKSILDKSNFRIAQLIDDSFTALSDSLCKDTSNAVRLKAALSVLKIFHMERIENPFFNESAGEPHLKIPDMESPDDTKEEPPHAP